MNFIQRTVGDKREDGKTGDGFPRPSDRPAQGESEEDAADGEGGEVLGLIPKVNVEVGDLGSSERREIKDGSDPPGEGLPGEDAKPKWDRIIHGSCVGGDVSR